jgi:glycosyltransferase involved in cell wall biosynthesis
LGERFNAITVCSQTDKQYLQNLGVPSPVHVIPNGYQRPAVDPSPRPAKPPRIGFIGVFDHGPNVEGIRWFVRECWPRIKREVPDARLRLVGRLSDGPLKPHGVDIDAFGWVPDPTDEIATWSAMVVPVHVGAGTRGKIAHAFSQRCPVVSTSLGAYGYDARDGQEMFLAESAETFAEACVRTIRQPASAAAMADRAWQQFLDKWTWDAIRPHIWAAAEACLRAK